MATAIKTVYTYNLNGTQKDFNVPFEYLARKFVRVTLIGKDRKILVLNQDYRFATKTTITTTQAWGPAQGYSYIEVRRYTSATERLIDYTDGSILRAYDLNISQLQTIHVAEEARDLTADTIGVNNDGELDARGRRIVNLVDAVHDRDAVTFGQVKSMSQGAWQSRNQAEQFKNQAKGFRDEAEVSRNAAEAAKARAGASELKAKDWATKENAAVEGDLWSAKHYSKLTANDRAATFQSKEAAERAQLAAEAAQRHAANSQSAAATSAKDSKKEADRAKSEADKLGNMNALAGTIQSVNGENVTFKGLVGSMKGFVSAYADGLRIRQASNSMIHRFDGSNYYMLFSDTVDGTWNAKRPLSINFGNGLVTMNHGVNISGDVLSTTGRFLNKATPGAGGLANQLSSNAAFAQELPGNQDGNVYYPLVKQYGRRSNGYPTALSFGLVSQGKNGFHLGCLNLIGDNNNNKSWMFNIDGSTSFPGQISSSRVTSGGDVELHGSTILFKSNSRRHIQYNTGSQIDGYFFKDPGAGSYVMNFGSAASCEYNFSSAGNFVCSKGWTIAADGNIKGSTWGNNWLHSWLNENTVNRIQMGAVQSAGLWKGPGIGDGGGKVITGIVNGNRDEFVDTAHWRVMQYVRNNGRAYNIY